jgi:hypothetical protein
MKAHFRTIALVLALGAAAYAAYAETVTISTYYPSPYGSYQQLDTTNLTSLATAGGNVLMVGGGGNVGIGTNNPAAKLHVEAGGAIRPRFVSPTDSMLEFYNGNNRRSFVGWKNSGDAPAPAGVYLWNTDNTPIFFGTTNAERVRIAANGNMGVGTNNPAHLLHVNGNAYVSGNLRLQAGGQQGNLQITCDGNNCYPVYA